MSTQQDIYAAGSENRPPMLNKDNYVPWSSRIIRYARSRPNGKMIVDSIENGPYVRRMIATLGEPDLPVLVPKSFHEQTYEELTEINIKRMDANDQAIKTILLGLPEDVYPVVDSFETAKKIWERVRQMMKGSDIEEQEKKAKLFNKWETNKHFPENIASNLKFLNNLQPEWKRHVTIVRQTKNLHEADFTQIYDFLKMNQDEVNELRAESLSTHSQQSFPINNKYNPQPSLNQNFMQPPMTSLEGINDPTEAMNAALILFAKAFQLSAPTNNNQRTSFNPRNRQIAHPVMNMGRDRQIQNNGGIQGAQNTVQNMGVQSGGNQNELVVVTGIANQNGTGNVVAARAEGTGNGNQAKCYNCRGLGHIARNCTARPIRMDDAYLQTQLLIAQKEEAGVQLQAEEFDFMATGDLDEIKEVNANCILMANLQQASTSGTQHDKAPVYDTDGSAENENHVTSVNLSMMLSGDTVETSFAPNEETRAHQETVYRNLVDQVAQEDKFLDKEVELEAKIKDLENILLKRNQTVQTMHMLNPKLDSFYHPNQKMALEEHDPPAVYDLGETLELAQESHEKITSLNKEIKPANYAKINHLSRVFVPQTTKSKEELLLSNVSNMVTVSKMISIPNEDLSDDITPSVPHKIISHEIAPIINQVDARVQNFEIQFLQEAAKFVRDIKSLAKEADESLDKQKSLELEIKRLLKASVKQLQAQLRDLKGKSSDTPSASNTLDPLNQKLESKIIVLEFQVVNYEREISHLKTTYKNLFDSIASNRAHAKLHNLVYENAKLRAQLFENTSEPMNNTSWMSVTPHGDKPKLSAATPVSKKLHASMSSHFVPQCREFNVVKHKIVIAPEMFKINPSQTPCVDLVPNKQSSASIKTNPITNSQRHVTIKKNVSSNTVTASST
nr:hypothetical protein [Tanacetum cinerariifolium]